VTFPSGPFDSITTYLDSYIEHMTRAYASINGSMLERAAQMLLDTIARDGQIFSCGNGGSAAISNHLV
jgi:phosphoheptose isomerase